MPEEENSREPWPQETIHESGNEDINPAREAFHRRNHHTVVKAPLCGVLKTTHCVKHLPATVLETTHKSEHLAVEQSFSSR